MREGEACWDHLAFVTQKWLKGELPPDTKGALHLFSLGLEADTRALNRRNLSLYPQQLLAVP